MSNHCIKGPEFLSGKAKCETMGNKNKKDLGERSLVFCTHTICVLLKFVFKNTLTCVFIVQVIKKILSPKYSLKQFYCVKPHWRPLVWLHYFGYQWLLYCFFE